MKAAMIEAHLDVAQRYAGLSKARRLQVGAIVVKDDRIISIGYNGTAPGDDNNCEDMEWMPRDIGGWIDPPTIHAMFPLTGEHPEYGQWPYRLKTKDTVIHAEENAIAKLARSHESGQNAEMFITHAPCQQCARMILQSGIRSVWYRQTYKNTLGVEYLRQHGVECTQVNDNNKALGMQQL